MNPDKEETLRCNLTKDETFTIIIAHTYIPKSTQITPFPNHKDYL